MRSVSSSVSRVARCRAISRVSCSASHWRSGSQFPACPALVLDARGPSSRTVTAISGDPTVEPDPATAARLEIHSSMAPRRPRGAPAGPRETVSTRTDEDPRTACSSSLGSPRVFEGGDQRGRPRINADPSLSEGSPAISETYGAAAVQAQVTENPPNTPITARVVQVRVTTPQTMVAHAHFSNIRLYFSR